MPKVIKISEYTKTKKPKRNLVLALCMECCTRWFGSVMAETCLLCLDCPKCGKQNSFASFIPNNYFNVAKTNHDHVGRNRNKH